MRTKVVVLLGLATLLVLGALAPSASALSAVGKRALTKENVHLLDVAVRSYASDHGDLYPQYTTGHEFRALLRPYLFTGHWPVNPFTGRPVRVKRSAGNVSYGTYSNQTRFRLIGWGRHGHRLMVVHD
jgi:hypothetical protein